jgi:hypothetical protein
VLTAAAGGPPPTGETLAPGISAASEAMRSSCVTRERCLGSGVDEAHDEAQECDRRHPAARPHVVNKKCS